MWLYKLINVMHSATIVLADKSGSAPSRQRDEVSECMQEDSPQASLQKRQKTTVGESSASSWWEDSDRWVHSKDILVALDDLDVHAGLEKGQVQLLKEDIWKERMKDLKDIQLYQPLEVTVWTSSLSDPSMLTQIFMRALA